MKHIETFEKFAEMNEGSTMKRFDGSSIYDEKQRTEMTKDDLLGLEGLHTEKDSEDGIKKITYRDIPSNIKTDFEGID